MIKSPIYLILVFSCWFVQGQDSIAKKKAIGYAKISEDFYKKGDNEKHKLYSDSLLLISQEHKFYNLELLAMMNQGIYYKNTNQLKKALNTYLIVLDKCENVPNSEKNKIMTMVNMGNIYNNINEADKAIRIFKDALPLIKKYPDNKYILSAVYSGLGKANTILGNIDTSLQYQYKLKHLADTLSNTYLQVTALTDISDLLNQKKDYKNGLKTAKAAIRLNSTFSDSVLKKDAILLNMGIAFKGLKQIDSAKAYLNQAKTIAVDKKNLDVEMYAEKYLADIYEQLKDFEASQKSQKRYLELNVEYLKNQKETAVLDVEKEAEKKIKTAEDKSRVKTYALIFGFALLLSFLGGFLLFNRQRKQQIVKKNKQLQNDYKWLQTQYASLKENLQQLSKEKNKAQDGSEKYKNSSLNQQDRERYMHQILEFMEQKKPYLDMGLTQAQFAKETNIPTHHLSEVLTLSFEQNFYNFINFYRIDKAQNLLNHPDYKNYTIEAIAYESGFGSKTSFNRVFKSMTGKTPSEYRKSDK